MIINLIISNIQFVETIQFVITTKNDYETLEDVVVVIYGPGGFASRSDTDAQWIIATDNKSMKWRIQVNNPVLLMDTLIYFFVNHVIPLES